MLTDVAHLIVAPTTSLRQILQRINLVPQHFQLVVDGEGRLLGTITDGDIRRALLRAFDLDAPASFCMNASPIVGLVNDPFGNQQKLLSVPVVMPFLPILSESGRLYGVIVTDRAPLEAVKTALVMAGGEGRRLGELTRNTPKPLLVARGRPIIDRLLEHLEDSGVELVFISVRYLAEQIQAFVAARNNRADIRFLSETEPLGTGGAISLLPDDFDEPLLVVNGDVLTEIDFHELKAFNDRHGFDGCVAVARHQVSVPFGVVDQTAEGVFAGIREKPIYTHLISAGIYYLTPALRSVVPPRQAIDMPEILTLGTRAGLRIGLFPVHESWRDMGRPDDFLAEQ